MRTYYLRCRVTDRDRLLQLGVALGAIAIAPATGRPYALLGGEYYEIGELPDRQTGTLQPGPNGEQVYANRQPRREGGQVLYHANLRTPMDLRQRAQELAAGNPEIAAALGNLRRYFVANGANTQAITPTEPQTIFFGD